MARVRCPICSASTDDAGGACEMCGSAFDTSRSEAQQEARAARDAEAARADGSAPRAGSRPPIGINTYTVRQLSTWREIFIGWNTRNRYEVLDADGEPAFQAGEVGGSALARAFLGSGRPFTIELRTLDGQLAILVRRPWALFFASVDIEDGDGNLLGTVERGAGVTQIRYEIRDADERPRAQIVGSALNPWTFEILENERPRGAIRKEYDQRQVFSKADTFGVECDPSWDETMHRIALGATFLIDFVHFEAKR